MSRATSDAMVDAVRSMADQVVTLCADLVAAPSITPPGDTTEVAAVAASWLRTRGLPVATHSLRDDMPNLVVTVEGALPGPHVIFNGHLDTMGPGDADQWTVPLFELTKREGRLHGLGMGNMKGAVAAFCAAASIVAAERHQFAGSLTLTLVSDEVRFGDNGTAFLLDELPWLREGYVISGEGAGWMQPALAEKGVAWIDIEAEGPPGHSSAAQAGTTASARLAAAIVALDDLNTRHIEPPSGLASVIDELHPGSRIAVNTGTLAAGDARSMMAPRARAELDIRLPPGLGLEDLDALVASRLGGIAVRWRRTRGWPANWTDGAHPLVRAVADALGAVRGEPATLTVRHPASDAMRWRRLGAPAVLLGPQPTLSAGIDDYAEEGDVLDCAATYATAALTLVDYVT